MSSETRFSSIYYWMILYLLKNRFFSASLELVSTEGIERVRTPLRIMYFVSCRFHSRVPVLARSGPRRCIAKLHMREARMQRGHTEQAYLLYKSAIYSRHRRRWTRLFFHFIGHLIKQELLIYPRKRRCSTRKSALQPPRWTRSSVALTSCRNRCITLRIITCTCVNNYKSSMSSISPLIAIFRLNILPFLPLNCGPAVDQKLITKFLREKLIRPGLSKLGQFLISPKNFPTFRFKN